MLVQQQEEPDDDENVMDLEALKSRTTHTVSCAAAIIMHFKMQSAFLIFLVTDVHIYIDIYFLNLVAGVRAVVQTGRHPGVNSGCG